MIAFFIIGKTILNEFLRRYVIWIIQKPINNGMAKTLEDKGN